MIDQKKIKELHFCMENLEYFSVPISEVEYFNFINIHQNMRLLPKDELFTATCCDEALVILKQTANDKAKSSFDLSEINSLSFFDRLQAPGDCVGIDIIFEEQPVEIDNGEKQLFKQPPDPLEIYVPWEDDRNEQTNKLQRTQFQLDENLVGYKGLIVHFGRTTKLLDSFNEDI